MTSEEYEDILYDHRILKWSARILGTLELAFLLYLANDQLIKGIIDKGLPALIPLLGGQYFLAITLTIAFIGLVIAYWKEGLGGGIALAGWIVLFIGWSDFHVSFILGMTLASLPSILYIAYWFSVYLDLKKIKQDRTKAVK